MNNFDNLNYRQKLQLKQSIDIKEKFGDLIKEKSKYKETKTIQTIEKNFIQYSDGTILLLNKIIQQIYQNKRLYGVEATFLTTARQLTTYNKELKISKSVNSTIHRLNVLQNEGVIYKLDTPYKNGSCFVLTADPTKIFNRKDKKDFKIKGTITTPEEKDLQQLKQEEINELEQLEKEKEEIEKRIEELKKQKIEKEKKEEEITNETIDILKEELKDFEIKEKKEEKNNNIIKVENTLLECIEKLKELDIGDKDKDEFIKMFIEFCDKRKDSKGVKIDKANNRAIIQRYNNLVEVKKYGINPYDFLNDALAGCWKGLQYTLNNIKEKYTKKSFNQIQIEDNLNILQKISNNEITTKEQLNKELSTNTTARLIQLNNYSKELNTQIGKEQAKKIIAKEKEKRYTTSLRMIKQLKDFNYTYNINNKNLFINVLDNDIGKKCYTILTKYYSKKIGDKYPNDKKRRVDFECYANSMLDIARDNNIKYLPFIYTFNIFEKLPVENSYSNDKNWFEVADYTILKNIFEISYYNNWIKEAIENYKTKNKNIKEQLFYNLIKKSINNNLNLQNHLLQLLFVSEIEIKKEEKEFLIKTTYNDIEFDNGTNLYQIITNIFENILLEIFKKKIKVEIINL